MSEPVDNTNYQLANDMYKEGGDYMKIRTLYILKEELTRHRKGSSGHATLETLIEKVSLLPNE